MTHCGFDKVSTVALGFDRFGTDAFGFDKGALGFDRRALVSTGGFDIVADKVIPSRVGGSGRSSNLISWLRILRCCLQ